MAKKTKITLDELAGILQTGFKTIRAEMATADDMKVVKKDLKYVKEILDSEVHFIKQMQTEYPIFIKRLERAEDKLGLPHHITE